MKKLVLTLMMAFCLSTQASLVGSALKVLLDAADRYTLLGRLATDTQVGEYDAAIRTAIMGLSGGNASPSQADVLRIINGSSLDNAQKERLVALLNKDHGELTTEELNEITNGLMTVAHRVDPQGVLLTSCQGSCMANTAGLNNTISIVTNDAMRAVLRRYPNESAQRTRINSLLRSTRMGGRLGGNSAEVVTPNGSDMQSMLIFLEVLANPSGFPEGTVNFARAIKEFSKKADGSYDVFDSGNKQALYRLMLEVEEGDHVNYARNFQQVANNCAAQYPKKDCFYTELENVAVANGVPRELARTETQGMRARNCWF